MKLELNTLAFVFYGYGAFLLLAIIGSLAVSYGTIGAILALGPSVPRNELLLMLAISAGSLILTIALTVPFVVVNFIAGWAIRTRHRWAQVAGLVAAALAATSFPIGTIVGVVAILTLIDAERLEELKHPLPDPPKE